MNTRCFGVIDGNAVEEITISSAAGAVASILTWGATMRDLVVPTQSGGRRRVVLGYETLDGYRDNPSFLGSTVGRNANRISGGRFCIDGVAYQLPVNGDGGVHLHGGPKGFHRRPWRIVDADESSVLLSLVSEDGDQGYPGRLTAYCHYQILEPAILRVTMTATTDAPTIVNLTNHSYFTLNDAADCRAHSLVVYADYYTPSTDALIPTGEIRAVAGTPYNFLERRSIASGGIDYDVNFVLGHRARGLTPAAVLYAPDGELVMRVATNTPCLLLYTGKFLMQAGDGLGGQMHGEYSGLCLETNAYVDAPNKPHFPTTILRPGEVHRNVAEYAFFPQ